MQGQRQRMKSPEHDPTLKKIYKRATKKQKHSLSQVNNNQKGKIDTLEAFYNLFEH